ncbi:MAG: hypothetical protein Q8K60_04945, partial [Parachlamydiaceae bacterium]|nr:hypothetical protein [Parachlamydiaceae bacterium]
SEDNSDEPVIGNEENNASEQNEAENIAQSELNNKLESEVELKNSKDNSDESFINDDKIDFKEQIENEETSLTSPLNENEKNAEKLNAHYVLKFDNFEELRSLEGLYFTKTINAVISAFDELKNHVYGIEWNLQWGINNEQYDTLISKEKAAIDLLINGVIEESTKDQYNKDKLINLLKKFPSLFNKKITIEKLKNECKNLKKNTQKNKLNYKIDRISKIDFQETLKVMYFYFALPKITNGSINDPDYFKNADCLDDSIKNNISNYNRVLKDNLLNQNYILSSDFENKLKITVNTYFEACLNSQKNSTN